MAGMDYLKCEKCGKRLAYMGEAWDDIAYAAALCNECGLGYRIYIRRAKNEAKRMEKATKQRND